MFRAMSEQCTAAARMPGAAWRVYRRHWLMLVVSAALPACVVIVTIASEFALRSGGAHALLETTGTGLALGSLLALLRMAALCFAALCWCWCAGVILVDDDFTLADCWQLAWRRSMTLLFAALPLWFVFIFALVSAAIAARLLWTLFAVVGASAGSLALLFLASIALPPVIAVAAKCCLVAPVAAFRQTRPLEALAEAFAKLPWRACARIWPVTAVCGAMIVATILLPAGAFVESVWRALALAAPALVLAVQLVAAAIVWLAGAPGMIVATMLYFELSPELIAQLSDAAGDNAGQDDQEE